MNNLTFTLKIKVSSNKQNRTFTIRKTYSDGSTVKYRTNPMSREEFNDEAMNTTNDWKQFLKSDDYYIV